MVYSVLVKCPFKIQRWKYLTVPTLATISSRYIFHRNTIIHYSHRWDTQKSRFHWLQTLRNFSRQRSRLNSDWGAVKVCLTLSPVYCCHFLIMFSLLSLIIFLHLARAQARTYTVNHRLQYVIHSFIRQWLYIPFLGTDCLCNFVIQYTVGFLGRGISPS